MTSALKPAPFLRAAQIHELRRLAADTAQTFTDAQRCTSLSGVEIAQRMEAHLDAYRDERPAQPAAVAESVHPCRKPRPLFVLPSQPHLRQALMRCLLIRR
jgi:hypothetical protein